jgi:type VI secretion system protein ImpF
LNEVSSSAGLVDRLADASGGPGRAASSPDLRATVSRDLEALLNTRSEAVRLISDAYPECRKSSLTFGIPDFSSYNLFNPSDRDKIRRSIEQAIGLHEGRLSRVRVTLEAPKPLEKLLRFRVEALLELGPQREKVQFDATLQLTSQAYQVR